MNRSAPLIALFLLIAALGFTNATRAADSVALADLGSGQGHGATTIDPGMSSD